MFRFTIRDVLWLTVVVAMALGWAIEFYRSPNTQLKNRAETMEFALTQEGFTIEQPNPFYVIIAKSGLSYETTYNGQAARHSKPGTEETITVP